MKKLLMATDLSARSDRALARAVSLASDHGADLIIVHVVDEGLPESMANAQKAAAGQNIQEHLNTLATDNGPNISFEIVLNRDYIGILEMSEKTDAEMIVLGVHREDVFKDMYRGTTAERIIRASHVPVLVVKERADKPYRRVMVGVDFSIFSRRAVEFAVRFVPGGQFHLVHAYEVPFKGFMRGQETRRKVSREHEAQFREMVEEEMANFFASLKTKAPKLERVMKDGLAREVILEQAGQIKPDLLVVGTHSRTGVAYVFLGSVAEDVLRMPPCDVLAVNAR